MCDVCDLLWFITCPHILYKDYYSKNGEKKDEKDIMRTEHGNGGAYENRAVLQFGGGFSGF